MDIDLEKVMEMARNAYFDNAKVILIFLVVFGHLIQPFIGESEGINTLYMWIYTFHMPAFIFLAGFFAKGSGNLTYIFNLAKKLLIPYLCFQLLYTLYYVWLGKTGWQGIFYPQWSLWFLFSLFSWHLLLIGFKKIPAFFSVTVAMMIGLIVGYFEEVGHLFSLSRTFVFFPFFLFGYWCTKEQVMWLKRKAIKIGSLIILIIGAVAIYFAPDLNSGWLFASKSYGELQMPAYGGAARLFVYATSTLMAMSVLAWMPRKQQWFTSLGTKTLYVYLLHGFFIQFFRQKELFEATHLLDVIWIGLIAAMIVLFLSSQSVLGIWQPVIEGKMSILKRFFHRDDKRFHHEMK